MGLRVFNLRFEASLGGFDDKEVQTFLLNKEVISVHEHFFVHNEIPWLVLVARYDENQRDKAVETIKPREEWRENMEKQDEPLFDHLRQWRNQKAQQEGVPPYVICNNTQLAKIAQLRPQSLSALSQIDGIGKAKLNKYGQAMLDQCSIPLTSKKIEVPHEPSK